MDTLNRACFGRDSKAQNRTYRSLGARMPRQEAGKIKKHRPAEERRAGPSPLEATIDTPIREERAKRGEDKKLKEGKHEETREDSKKAHLGPKSPSPSFNVKAGRRKQSRREGDLGRKKSKGRGRGGLAQTRRPSEVCLCAD